MLILSDFDGTITTEDVTNLLWDRYGIPGWREKLLPAYHEGRVTTLDLMDEGWRTIGRTAAELVDVARREIELRAGFLDLVASCGRRGWQLHVISCGLDWYLKAFLPAGVGYTCYDAVLEDGWRVRLPEGCRLEDGADFKIHVMQRLQAAGSHEPTAFIGDGRNDLPIARACDRVFAVQDSTLARLCRRHGVPFEEFETFETVIASLAEWSAVLAAGRPMPPPSA